MKLGAICGVFLVLIGLSFGETKDLSPCGNYRCDSLVVASILDTNGLSSIRVEDVSKSGSFILNDSAPVTRLRELDFSGRGLFIVPASIVKLNVLNGLSLENNKLVSLPPEITALDFYSDYIPGFGELRVNTLNVDSNSLCNPSPSIENWIYAHVPGTRNNAWKSTQRTVVGKECSADPIGGRFNGFSFKRILVNNKFSFDSKISNIRSAFLYSANGREVKEAMVESFPNGFSLKFGLLHSGIYILKMVSANENGMIIKKFVLD